MVGGTTRMETTSGSVIVIAAVVADCWDAASGEAASTPVPRAVVTAEPESAEPVAANVWTAEYVGPRTDRKPWLRRLVLMCFSHRPLAARP